MKGDRPSERASELLERPSLPFLVAKRRRGEGRKKLAASSLSLSLLPPARKVVPAADIGGDSGARNGREERSGERERETERERERETAKEKEERTSER